MIDVSLAKTPRSNTLAILEKVIADSCECKLRAKCEDKNSADCLKHKNIYAEAMQKLQTQRLNQTKTE